MMLATAFIITATEIYKQNKAAEAKHSKWTTDAYVIDAHSLAHRYDLESAQWPKMAKALI